MQSHLINIHGVAPETGKTGQRLQRGLQVLFPVQRRACASAQKVVHEAWGGWYGSRMWHDSRSLPQIQLNSKALQRIVEPTARDSHSDAVITN